LNFPGLKELWRKTLGSKDVCIAFLDGPADHKHTCLYQADIKISPVGMEDQSDFILSQHGTHVLSIVFGNHQSRIKGVAPNCRGLLIPIYKELSDGSLQGCDPAILATSINEAIRLGANIINISGGASSENGNIDPALERAIDQAEQQNVLIVAATGNDGSKGVDFPSNLETVLAVGAADDDGNPLEFSNWTPDLQSHGVLAPGINIAGATPGGGCRYLTGTSFATPIISGICALLSSLAQDKGVKLTSAQLRKLVLDSAVNCDSEHPSVERCLGGRVHVGLACKLLDNLLNQNHSAEIVGNKILEPQFYFHKPTIQKDHAMTNEIRRSEIDNAEEAILDSVTPNMDSDIPDSGNRAAIQNQTPTDNHEPVTTSYLSNTVSPSSCDCDKSVKPANIEPSERADFNPFSPIITFKDASLVFSIGELGYDFGTEARLDYFKHVMGTGKNPNSYKAMADYLNEKNESGIEIHFDDSCALIWTLNIDNNPVYAILPQTQFGVLTFKYLVDMLDDFADSISDKMSISGYISGTTRLYNGTVVPTISPVLRGMFNWNSEALISSVYGSESHSEEEEKGLHKFLDRVYYQLRNTGQSPMDRAINYAATNAYQAKEVYRDAFQEKLELSTIDVVASKVCRPGSDCWDVKLKFFDPQNTKTKGKKIYAYTVDVSDAVPITVGELRSWYDYE